MTKAWHHFDRVFDPTGDFGNRQKGDDKEGKHRLAGTGVLSVLMTSEKKSDKMVREGLKMIPHSLKSDYYSADTDLYTLYFNTQARFMAKESWLTWNQTFQDGLVSNQAPDGTWPPTGSTSPGTLSDPGIDGQLNRTTLCTLMLETYYRYLPISR
jgi:hypothetical protein